MDSASSLQFAEKSLTATPRRFLADGDMVVALTDVTVGDERGQDADVFTVRDGKMVQAQVHEGVITGTYDGEWAGMPPAGRRIEVPVVGIFEFDADRLLREKVHLDMATVLKQIGVLPAIG